MRGKIATAALGLAAALVLTGCGGGTSNGGAPKQNPDGAQNITMWVVGSDTPQEARDYLVSQYKTKNGGTLTITEQSWNDIITKLTTNMPDPDNTPDVTELGNTQSATFTNVGAFLDITDMYDKLGGSKLLQSFVEVGKVDGKNYTLPYYFGSRYVFYRKDVWNAAGITQPPKTLDEFNTDVAKIAEANPMKIDGFSGFYLGGQDWRDGISWIFANGGDIAKVENGTWKATLDDPNTLKGLQQLQDLYTKASKAPKTAKDASQYIYLNDSDESTKDASGNVVNASLSAATVMAPAWAHWSIGTLSEKDGKPVRTWDDSIFGVFALPGTTAGTPAPVFAGGSNIGISAQTKNQYGAKQLMEIIFSADYQQMLAKNGLGPANTDYINDLGTDEFAKALIASASNSKLTPAAPGWAEVEAQGVMEALFQAVAEGGNINDLAKQYNTKLDALLNNK